MRTPSTPPRAVKPGARTWFLKGNDCLARGQKLEAARCFYQAVREQPDFSDAHYNLGLALHELKQLAEACACYEQVVRLQSDHASAWNNLGVARRQLGQCQKAVESHRRAVTLDPGQLDFKINLANALRAGEMTLEAIHLLQQTLQNNPGSAALWHTLGNAWREAGRLAESEEAFRRALHIAPGLVESHWDLAFTLLLKGDFLSGWDEYEWRWQRKDHPARSFDTPAWQGENLAGKRLLVYAEQGAGDTIQFARFIPLLAQRGARVILECPRALVSLLRTLPGVEQVIARGEALPRTDYQCALLSLPRWFRTTQHTIPAGVPYLQARVDGPRLPTSAPSPDGRPLRVGLVWSGNPEHQNDARRSIAAEILRPWLAKPEAVFYSLQPKPASGAGKPPQADDLVTDLADLIGDYADTACLIRQLDLVISVDTSVAHLAGALGHPVWLLLPFAPDWRWLMERHDSAWYPSMTIFRQPVAGDWNSVLNEVGVNLRQPRKAAKKPSPE